MTRKKWENRLAEQLPHLLRYAKALTRNNELAEDLVQDCLERAWTKKLMWNPSRKLRPWLFSIMHNLFINQLNKRTVSTTSISNFNTDDAVMQDIVGNVNEDNSHLLQLRDLQAAMGKLSPEYREIILLAGLEDLSYKEIAKITNVALGTVMSRLSRAREKLRLLMDGEETDNVVKIR